MSNYTIKKINSVKDFVDLIEKIKEENVNRGNKSDLLFRGQQKDQN